MKIEDKLHDLWCRDDIEGKTVSKISYDIISFCDGTYYYHSQPEDLMNNYKNKIDKFAEDHPLVLVGVLTADEINMHWERKTQEWKEMTKAGRRQQYERLKQEFEEEDD